jgi:uncharacterized protein (TIGR00725 family)
VAERDERGRQVPEQPVYVAVVGPGAADAETERVAEDLGHALAGRGAVVVCGGLSGVMAAACRGAKGGRGTTVGILPGTDRAEANPWVDVAVPTGMGELRNGLVVRAADVVVAVAGEFGTLSEIGLALKLGTPVIGLGTWELARSGRSVEAIERVRSAVAAADRAVEVARR